MAKKGRFNKGQQLDELYFDWQIELAHRYVAIQLTPSAFKHLDRREAEKCIKYSPHLRDLLAEYHGDIILVKERLGQRRVSRDVRDYVSNASVLAPDDSAMVEQLCAWA